MKQHVIHHLSVFLIALMSGQALANEQNIVVGLYNSPPSAEYYNGSIEGISVRFVREVVAAVDPNITITFRLGTLPRLLREMEKGHLDLTYLLESNKLPKESVKVSLAYTGQTELWSKKDNPILSGAPLIDLRIGALQHNFKLPIFQGTQNVPVSTAKLLLPMLVADRVDAIYTFGRALNHHAILQNLSIDDFHREPISEVPIYLWTHKSSTVFQELEQWQAAAQIVHRPNVEKRIWSEYQKDVRKRAH